MDIQGRIGKQGRGATRAGLLVAALVASLQAAPAEGTRASTPAGAGETPSVQEATAPAPWAGGPLSLEAAVRLALSRNHVVRIEELGRPLAKAGLTEAWGAFDPKLSGSYGESLAETPLTPFGAGAGVRNFVGERVDSATLGVEGVLPWGTGYRLGANTWKLRNQGTSFTAADGTTAWAGVSVTQPLLRGFGPAAFARVRVARTNLALSEWEFRSVLMSTVTRTIAACAELEFAEARVTIARRSLEMAKQLRKENARREELGAMSEYDVLSAEARVASREETLQQAERGLVYAGNALLALVARSGAEVGVGGAPRVASLALPGPLQGTRAEDLRDALAKRPDYRQAELLRKRGSLEKGEALNQLLPRVDLIASYGRNALAGDVAGARADLRSREMESWSTGVQMSVPLGSFAERGRHRAAGLRLRQAELRLEKLEQDIALEIADVAARYESAHKRVSSAERARQLNQRALEAELKKLRAGTGTTFNVLYQQDQLNQAELTEAYARADLIRAAADYDQATGRTLETHGVAPLR